jgi:menaquinol-cytochrome c reductase iron-sulfur subunit
MSWLDWVKRLLPTRAAPKTNETSGPAAKEMDDAHEFDEADIGEPVSPERRRFLTKIGLAFAGLGATVAGIPVLGFLLSPVLRPDEEVWRQLGAVEDFRVGDTVKVNFLDPSPLPWAGFAARSAAWIRRVGSQEFVAFSIYCTHTGCPVAWTPGARLFICPCHGGAFYSDGSVASGPPPTELPLIPVRVRAGQVEILASPVARPT